MENILPIIMQLLGGAGAGNGIGSLLKKISLGPIFNTIVGMIGGFGGGYLAKLIPAIADGSGILPLIGNLLGGAVGGGLLTVIVGFIKSLISKN